MRTEGTNTAFPLTLPVGNLEGVDDPATPTPATDPDALRDRLTPEQFHVTQQCGTEPAFSGAYWDLKDAGTYRCVVCATPLFASSTKYDSGSGWPSFWEALDPSRVRLLEDRTHAMVRVEVRCANCDAHLGHVFPDGPRPTGDRFCMNSASLHFVPDAD